jgi:hypothetical protein
VLFPKGVVVGENSPVLMLRPKVKPEHAPYRIAGGTKIRIGGVSYGLAAEIADPGGWVWAMLSAMAGSRGVQFLAAQTDVSGVWTAPRRSMGTWPWPFCWPGRFSGLTAGGNATGIRSGR